VDSQTLQQLRNTRGPNWLIDYRHDFKRALYPGVGGVPTKERKPRA
jgi:hypothetical protein